MGTSNEEGITLLLPATFDRAPIIPEWMMRNRSPPGYVELAFMLS
jgi:hypothetical protein